MDESPDLMMRLHWELAQRHIGANSSTARSTNVSAVSTTSKRLLGKSVDYRYPHADCISSPPRTAQPVVHDERGPGVDEVNLRRHLARVDQERTELQHSLAGTASDLAAALARESELTAKLHAAQDIIEELELANRELVSSHSACAWRLREQIVRLNNQLLSDATLDQPRTADEWKAKCERLTERNIALLSDLTEAQQDVRDARDGGARSSDTKSQDKPGACRSST